MKTLTIKCLFAALCFIVLFCLPIHQSRPDLGYFALAAIGLGVFTGVAIVVGVFALAYTMIWGEFNQFMLNNGATDTQWLWFKNDPPGLAELRKTIEPQQVKI